MSELGGFIVSAELEQRIASQVRAALEVDDTRLGDVWRMTRDGMSPDQIAAQLENNTSTFVYKYLRFARALETGDLPTAPTMVRECAVTFRRVLNRHPEAFDPEVRTAIEQRFAMLRSYAEDPEKIDEEQAKIRRRANEVTRSGLAGIYVYTLPHYFHNPMVPADDQDVLIARTLMKVGRSEADVIRRFRQQERNTSLPEDPILLRIYVGAQDMTATERTFHSLMRTADHRRNRGVVAGTEWFVTSLEFLDAVASALGMTTHFRAEDAAESD